MTSLKFICILAYVQLFNEIVTVQLLNEIVTAQLFNEVVTVQLFNETDTSFLSLASYFTEKVY